MTDGFPVDAPIIDTYIGFVHADVRAAYSFLAAQTKDAQSRESFAMPAEYMFKDVPEVGLGGGDPVDTTLREMDRFNIERGLVNVNDEEGTGLRAVRLHPDRFIPSAVMDANEGMAGIRKLCELVDAVGVRAVSLAPMAMFPQVPINDNKMYPIYAKCVELGIPVFCLTGVPGPRLRLAPQKVELVDEVMYDFPELTFVMQHGAEPWTELAVKLMLKWPGLHYATTAFAPKYYPRDVIDFANSRGADKVIYGGYFPMGLSLERIMAELPHIGLKDDVWPKFLRHNALRVLGLERTEGS